MGLSSTQSIDIFGYPPPFQPKPGGAEYPQEPIVGGAGRNKSSFQVLFKTFSFVVVVVVVVVVVGVGAGVGVGVSLALLSSSYMFSA